MRLRNKILTLIAGFAIASGMATPASASHIHHPHSYWILNDLYAFRHVDSGNFANALGFDGEQVYLNTVDQDWTAYDYKNVGGINYEQWELGSNTGLCMKESLVNLAPGDLVVANCNASQQTQWWDEHAQGSGKYILYSQYDAAAVWSSDGTNLICSLANAYTFYIDAS